VLLVSVSINIRIKAYSKSYIFQNKKDVPKSYTALVLGAYVNKNGALSYVLQDRVNSALELYRHGKIKRFLLSGDHGRKNYDEVNSMKKYLKKQGVPEKDIFLDHAGFDTYSSMVRAKKVFLVEDVIIFTQEFHLARAVYIARKKGLNAFGYISDKRKYGGIKHFKAREYIACIKAYKEVVLNSSPKYLGDQIPITGNSRLSYD